jgi:hypothetical protein
MFSCERCGSKFHSTRAAAIEHCPRCLLKDDVSSPLLFAPFDRLEPSASPRDLDSVPEDAKLEPGESKSDLSAAARGSQEAMQRGYPFGSEPGAGRGRT